MKRLVRRRRGQGMTEYIIIVALVAVAAIGVVTLFGNNIRAVFASSADALAGEKETTFEGENASQQMIDKDLKTYGNQ